MKPPEDIEKGKSREEGRFSGQGRCDAGDLLWTRLRLLAEATQQAPRISAEISWRPGS
jgi:hypothetical protein